MLEFSFDRAPGIFRPCPRHVSTVHEVEFDVLEVCFDHAQGMFSPCSIYVATVLEVCFDRARNFLTVLDVRSTVFEVCFHCARVIF